MPLTHIKDLVPIIRPDRIMATNKGVRVTLQVQEEKATLLRAEHNVKVMLQGPDAKVRAILQADLVVRVAILRADLVVKEAILQVDLVVREVILQAVLVVKEAILHVRGAILQAGLVVRVAILHVRGAILRADLVVREVILQADLVVRGAILRADLVVREAIRQADLVVREAIHPCRVLHCQEKIHKENLENLLLLVNLQKKQMRERLLSRISASTNLRKKGLSLKRHLTPAIDRVCAMIPMSRDGEKNVLATKCVPSSRKRLFGPKS